MTSPGAPIAVNPMASGCLMTTTRTPAALTRVSNGTYARGSTRAPGWNTRPVRGVVPVGVRVDALAVEDTRTSVVPSIASTAVPDAGKGRSHHRHPSTATVARTPAVRPSA